MGDPDVFVISVDFANHVFSANPQAQQSQQSQPQEPPPMQQQQQQRSPSPQPQGSPVHQPMQPPMQQQQPLNASPSTTEDDFDLQLAEELGRIFRHYCAGGYSGYDVLPAENFNKFVRDCKMLDNLLTHDDMQSVFFELSVPGNDEVDVHHIVYEDFFSALGSLAARKYLYEDSVTAAVNNLLANNILPNACRATNDPKADQLYVPEVLDMFALHQDSLQKIFCFYKRARKWEDVAQTNSAMGAGEMGCLSHDFEIVPKLMSKHVLSKIMRQSSTVDGRVTLYFPQFCECLGRCALHIFSQHPFNSQIGPKPEHKVTALFHRMDIENPHELRRRLRTQPEAYRDLSGGPGTAWPKGTGQ